MRPAIYRGRRVAGRCPRGRRELAVETSSASPGPRDMVLGPARNLSLEPQHSTTCPFSSHLLSKVLLKLEQIMTSAGESRETEAQVIEFNF